MKNHISSILQYSVQIGMSIVYSLFLYRRIEWSSNSFKKHEMLIYFYYDFINVLMYLNIC